MRLIWFIILKIAEIGGVVFGPYYLGKWVHSWTDFFCSPQVAHPECPPFWIIGFICLLGPAVAIGLVVVFSIVNWELAGKLREKFN